MWHSRRVARGYSRDLRERLRQAWASGLSAAEIARTTGVSPSSLRRWKQKQAAGASLAPGASPGGPRRITADDEPALRAQVAATPMRRWPSIVRSGRAVATSPSASPP